MQPPMAMPCVVPNDDPVVNSLPSKLLMLCLTSEIKHKKRNLDFQIWQRTVRHSLHYLHSSHRNWPRAVTNDNRGMPIILRPRMMVVSELLRTREVADRSMCLPPLNFLRRGETMGGVRRWYVRPSDGGVGAVSRLSESSTNGSETHFLLRFNTKNERHFNNLGFQFVAYRSFRCGTSSVPSFTRLR